MAVEPRGLLSEPLAHLRRIVAASSTFQQWVGAADAAAALERVHYIDVDDDEAIRPHAMVATPPDWWCIRLSGGRGNGYRDGGEVLLCLESDISTEYIATHGDAHFEHVNVVSGVIEDLLTLSGTADTDGAPLMDIAYIEGEDGPWRSDPVESQSDANYYQTIMRIGYGVPRSPR